MYWCLVWSPIQTLYGTIRCVIWQHVEITGVGTFTKMGRLFSFTSFSPSHNSSPSSFYHLPLPSFPLLGPHPEPSRCMGSAVSFSDHQVGFGAKAPQSPCSDRWFTAPVATGFVDYFPKNKSRAMHKNKHDTMSTIVCTTPMRQNCVFVYFPHMSQR